MKLKLDENNHVVVQNEMPVYVHPDGQESPLDALSLVTKVTNLTEEKQRFYDKSEKLAGDLKVWEGLDATSVKKAMETVKNLDDKKLIEAGEVDELKKTAVLQYKEMFDREKDSLIQQFGTKESEFKTILSSKDMTINHLLISSNFDRSPWFSGTDPKTLLPPDIAAEHFGKFFEVTGEGKDVKIVGKLNGEIIPSREKIGNPASFEEAIAIIIDQYPHKNQILKATDGGPRANGNFGDNDGVRFIRLAADQAKDPAIYRAAKEKAAKNGVQLIVD
jgi:hypothetical protein